MRSLCLQREWARSHQEQSWSSAGCLCRYCLYHRYRYQYPQGKQRRHLLASTRTDLAVLHRWSDMNWFCLLKLAAGHSVSAWVGAARYQKDVRDGLLKGILPGGGTQYFIPGLRSAPGADVRKYPTYEILGKMARQPNWRG